MNNNWSSEEILILKTNYERNFSKLIFLLPKRKHPSIRVKAWQLGLKRIVFTKTCRKCLRSFETQIKKRKYCFSCAQNGKETARLQARETRIKALKTIGDGEIVCSQYKILSCCCGRENEPYIQIDHINGDGAKDLKKFGNRQMLYRWIIKHPKEARLQYQLLCSNANWVKRIAEKNEGGFNPKFNNW